jgi:phosphoglycerate dehydrogenase-like enzyme
MVSYKHRLYNIILHYPIEFSKAIEGADVLIIEPEKFVLGSPVLCKPDSSLKFVQTIYAGCEYITDKSANVTPPPYPIARMGGKFGIHMAEYVIAQIIRRERKFDEMLLDQKQHNWLKQEKYITYRRLSDLTIGILGLGDIGYEVAKYCKSFGMTVWGMTRSEVPLDKRISHIDEYRLTNELEEILSVSDYICSILPSTSETTGFLDKDGFRSCANKKSVFINIGRGNVVSEGTIVKAIRNGWLDGAILDVFIDEPLPATSELWDLPKVIISPHIAAYTFADDLADLFAEQVDRYLKGQPIKYAIDWGKRY